MKTWFMLTEDCEEYVDDIVQMEMFVNANQMFINGKARIKGSLQITMVDIYKLFGVPNVPTKEELRGWIIDGVNTFLYFNTQRVSSPNGKKYVLVRVESDLLPVLNSFCMEK